MGTARTDWMVAAGHYFLHVGLRPVEGLAAVHVVVEQDRALRWRLAELRWQPLEDGVVAASALSVVSSRADLRARVSDMRHEWQSCRSTRTRAGMRMVRDVGRATSHTSIGIECSAETRASSLDFSSNFRGTSFSRVLHITTCLSVCACVCARLCVCVHACRTRGEPDRLTSASSPSPQSPWRDTSARCPFERSSFRALVMAPNRAFAA